MYVCRACHNHLAVGESVLSKVSTPVTSITGSPAWLSLVDSWEEGISRSTRGSEIPSDHFSAVRTIDKAQSMLSQGRHAVHICSVATAGGYASHVPSFTELTINSNSQGSTVEPF